MKFIRWVFLIFFVCFHLSGRLWIDFHNNQVKEQALILSQLMITGLSEQKTCLGKKKSIHPSSEIFGMSQFTKLWQFSVSNIAKKEFTWAHNFFLVQSLYNQVCKKVWTDYLSMNRGIYCTRLMITHSATSYHFYSVGQDVGSIFYKFFSEPFLILVFLFNRLFGEKQVEWNLM